MFPRRAIAAAKGFLLGLGFGVLLGCTATRARAESTEVLIDPATDVLVKSDEPGKIGGFCNTQDDCLAMHSACTTVDEMAAQLHTAPSSTLRPSSPRLPDDEGDYWDYHVPGAGVETHDRRRRSADWSRAPLAGKRCLCLPHFRSNAAGDQCYRRGIGSLGLGAYCEDSRSCMPVGNQSAYCKNNRCDRCSFDTALDVYDSTCKPIVDVLGASCDHRVVCYLPRDGLDQLVDCLPKEGRRVCQCAGDATSTSDKRSCVPTARPTRPDSSYVRGCSWTLLPPVPFGVVLLAALFL